MIPTGLKSFLLRALGRMSPMSEAALVNASLNAFSDEVVASDVLKALRELDTEKFVTRANDEISGATWALTTKGEHKAKQLG